MKIEVALYATLSQYLPQGSHGHKATMDCPDGVTVGQVIDQLVIPKPRPTMILINGLQAGEDTPLKEGDLLALFPPLAGGSPIALAGRPSCS
ncbi:MAG TPA: MoaD/ThiS family protein [Patescibacteria group bacterium]|nr:MoaD/ThiS family protein [Patescibacteria group bacterium]